MIPPEAAQICNFFQIWQLNVKFFIFFDPIFRGSKKKSHLKYNNEMNDKIRITLRNDKNRTVQTALNGNIDIDEVRDF